jgi:hypothetical protein
MKKLLSRAVVATVFLGLSSISLADGGGITSSIGTPVVGKLETFIFVDSYPNMAAWAAAKDAADGEDGNELDDMFDEVSECSENRLWSFEDTE